MSLFAYAPNDQSIAYLSQIFGVVGTVLPTSTATIFSGIFKVLNTTALTLGAILVIYVSIVGLLKTATEGEFLGKQWSSWALPLRMVFGIAGLFPTGGGYCMIQVVMMWIIVQGVGAGDQVWNAWLQIQNQLGGIASTVNSSTLPGTQGSSNPTKVPNDISVQPDFGAIFQGLMCQATAAISDPIVSPISTGNSPLYYCAPGAAGAGSAFCKQTPAEMYNITNPANISATVGSPVAYNMGPNGQCGTIFYPNPSNTEPFSISCPTTNIDLASVQACKTAMANGQSRTNVSLACPTSNTDTQSITQCAISQAFPQALQTAVSAMGSFAALLAKDDEEYVQFRDNPPTTAVPTSLTWLQSYCVGARVVPCCLAKYIPSGLLTNSKSCPISEPYQGCYYYSGLAGCTNIPFPVSSTSDYFNMNINQPSDVTNPGMIYSYAITDILGTSTPQTNNIFATIEQNFYGALNAAITAALANVPPVANSWQATAESQGWIYAGAYYYNLANQTNSTGQAALNPLNRFLQVQGPQIPIAGPLANYRNNSGAARAIFYALMVDQGASPGSAGAPPQLQGANNLLSTSSAGMLEGFMNVLTGGSNPLLQMASTGRSFILSGTIMYPVFIAISAGIIGAAAAADPGLLGTGIFGVGVGWAVAHFLITGVGLTVAATIGFLFTYGLLWAVYIPLIPYFIFTFGAIGWLMACVESMVAAPFVALGILSPGGDHEFLGRAGSSIGIIFNIFLRPTLLIIGFAFASWLIIVALEIINGTFLAVMGTIDSNPGPVEMYGFLAAYTFLVLGVVNKCFSIIYEVPDRVLSWISFQYKGYAEGEAAGAVSQKGEKSAEGMGSAASKSAGGAAATAGKTTGKLMNERNKANRK